MASVLNLDVICLYIHFLRLFIYLLFNFILDEMQMDGL